MVTLCFLYKKIKKRERKTRLELATWASDFFQTVFERIIVHNVSGKRDSNSRP